MHMGFADSSTTTKQVEALTRRYVVILRRSYIKNAARMIFWPLVIFGVMNFLFMIVKGKDSSKQMAFYIPNLSLFITIFHLHHYLTFMVNDRASGFRALLMIMGLRRSSYYLANLLCFGTFMGVITVTCAVICINRIFQDSEASSAEIVCLFLLLGIHLCACVFVLASCLTSTVLAIIVFGVVIIEPLYHMAIVGMASRYDDETTRSVILFLATVFPYESIHQFSESYRACTNCNKSQVIRDEFQVQVSQPTHLILAASLLWALVSFTFAFWFDQVCPWQRDLPPKNPLSCLRRTKRTPLDNLSLDDAFLKVDHRFERTTTGQPIGIRISNVTKKFDRVPVVDSLSFNIHRGETTLLLGHNGAGKTTLMNMIFGKLNPDSGSVSLNQPENIGGDRPFLGVCLQNNVLDENLTVEQHLELFADIKGSPADRSGHIKAIIEDVNLTGHEKKLPMELSGGMKRKLSLAMAFIGESSVLILDEPSSGLDPDSRIFIWDAIRRYRANRTVLLSTQHMEEADYLGDRIAIMKAGKIICCGSSSFLNKTFGFGYRLRLERRESKRDEVFAFIKNYFDEAVEETDIADSSSIESGEDRYVSMVVMLKGSKSQDPELHLIKMLEELERDMTGRHLRSFGLRSSTIEDVMLETAKMKTESSPQSSTSIGFDTKQPLNISPILLEAPKSPHSSHLVAQLYFLKALFFKHLHIYKRNIMSIVFFRLLLATGGMYWLVETVRDNSYTIGSINTLAIFHFIYYPAREKVSKFKAIQLSSDANFIIYWLSQLLIDSLSVVFLLVCVDVLLMGSMRGSMKYETPSNEVRMILQTGVALFALSALLLAYVTSTIVTSAETAIGLFQVPFITSVVISYLTRGIPVLLMDAKPETKQAIMKVNEVVESASIAILPTDSLRYMIYGLRSKCYIRTRELICIEKEGPSPVALGFVAMLAQIIGLSLLLYLIESKLMDFGSMCRWGNCLCFRRTNTPPERKEEDEDVSAEAAKALRIIDNPEASCSLVAADLSKSYVRGVRVIEDLWFTVARGECFGLLGVNGAGKSTTFSMIAAECKPDRGRVWLQGAYLDGGDVSAYRRNLGYAPQSSLEELALSPREALRLMARLRQVEEGAVTALVEATLEVLDMAQHGDKPASKLSGGTQRKLTLGMSLIGNPHLLALDEPTAGVDPMARRRIWRLLRSLRNQNSASIVIASHAMEECEAICDRISIMARGKLRCLGSFLHLRNKFSRRCTVRVQFSGQGEFYSGAMPTHLRAIRSLSERLSSIFGAEAIELVDSNINSATYSISDRGFKRSVLFGALREFKQSEGSHVSYLVNDSSLEDIFIELAREQRELLAQQRP